MSENPKHAQGRAKPGMFCAPSTAAYWWGFVHETGKGKYGLFNWRKSSVVASVYIDAAKRHMDLMAEGETTDPESGAPHAAHVMACMAILIDASAHGKLIDDLGMSSGALRAAMTQIGKRREALGMIEAQPWTDEDEQLAREVGGTD